MGSPKYSAGEKLVTVSDKFIVWLNSIEFKDDDEMHDALDDIRSECSTRLIAMDEEAVKGLLDESETENS